MDYYKLTKWECNIIQVGLDHIKEEFDFLTSEQIVQIQNLNNLLMDFCTITKNKYDLNQKKRFLDGNRKAFGFYFYEYSFSIMAITEIYIMHQDLLVGYKFHQVEDEEIEFSKDVIKGCKSAFKKLLEG